MKLRPYAEYINRLRSMRKVDNPADNLMAAERHQGHEAARNRKAIVEGQMKLKYRETQKLCKRNKLGAEGKKEVLEGRLLNFFAGLILPSCRTCVIMNS